MSAPPRSTVMLPRLTPAAAAPDVLSHGSAPGAADRPQTAREVPVGPGGGKLLSNALCMAHVELPRAVCAYLRLPFAAPRVKAPLGLARALLAIARHPADLRLVRGAGRATQLELERIGGVPEVDLVQELAARLESVAWPDWVPRVGFVMPFGHDIARVICSDGPPDRPNGISSPLLAARLVSAIRGPVFLRDAAPALSNLLNFYSGAVPSGTWDIWLPVQPGSVTPRLPVDPRTQGTSS